MPLQPQYTRVTSSSILSRLSFDYVKGGSRVTSGTKHQYAAKLVCFDCRSKVFPRRYYISRIAPFVGSGKHTNLLPVWSAKPLGLRLCGRRRITTTLQRQQSRQISRVGEQEKKWTTRTVDVPVGGNGHVSLDVSTLLPTYFDSEDALLRTKDLVVYLPPGPPVEAAAGQNPCDSLQEGLQEHQRLLEALALADSSETLQRSTSTPTLVKINYRLSLRNGTGLGDDEDYRFPSPVHDVSVAFEWIVNHLPELCSTSISSGLSVQDNIELEGLEPQTSVFGSHIGGSLALMLALTQPNNVHAVAVQDPIVDWVGLDELAASDMPSISAASSKRRNKAEAEESRLKIQGAALTLIHLRTRLFRNPSGFFDAFASPLMFLRAPGRDTPLWRTARPEYEGHIEDKSKAVEATKRDGGIEISQLETREVIHERGYGPYDDDWHTAEPELELQEAIFDTPARSATITNEEQKTTDLSTLSLNDQTSRSTSMQSETDLSQPQTFSYDAPRSSSDPIGGKQSTVQTIADPYAASGISIMKALRSSKTYNSTQPASSTPSRRRKVLRRWPAVGRPEDVELPYIKIYSTPPLSQSGSETDQCSISKIDLAHVLHPQAKEMVDVMRRACFWGREKSLAQEKVTLEPLPCELAATKNGQQVEVLKRAMQWLQEVGRIDV